MKLYPIVEGHGEVEAVPVLLRRLLAAANCYALDIGRPIRRTQSQFRNQDGVQAAVQRALCERDCAAIVLLFDGEDDCPKTMAAQVKTWAMEAANGRVPVEVVVAYREYETWFLAAVESLRGKYGIRADAQAPVTPESKRDAKGALEEYMPPKRAYSETGDQPGMSAAFDMAIAYQRNRSFRKLVKAIGDLFAGTGNPLQPWPPAGW